MCQVSLCIKAIVKIRAHAQEEHACSSSLAPPYLCLALQYTFSYSAIHVSHSAVHGDLICD